MAGRQMVRLIGSDALGTRLRLILATLGATVLAVACQKENV